MFDQEFHVDDSIPRMIAELMAGHTIEVTPGVSIEWTGGNTRTVRMRTNRIEFHPPVTAIASKWGVEIQSPLSHVDISTDGRTLELELAGPNVTIKLRPKTAVAAAQSEIDA